MPASGFASDEGVSPAFPTVSEAPRYLQLRRSLGWATLWVAIDGFVLGQVTLAMLCALYVLCYALPRALIAFRNVPRRNYYLMRAAVFAVVPVLVILLAMAQSHLAERNAARVVAAVERFYVERKVYPTSLDALVTQVPQYLDSVPRVKYVLWDGGFRYRRDGDKVTLMYTSMPPFGRRIYDFRLGKWSDLD